MYRLLTEELKEEESKEIQALRQDVQQAEQFFQHLGQKFIAGASGTGARSWYRRLEKRIPEAEAHAKLFQPVLNRLWHTVHSNDPNAKKPAGYNPAHIFSHAPLVTVQVYQNGEQLRVVAGNPAQQRNGSWLGALQTRNGQIAVDEVPAFWEGEAPAWASGWGKDKYGLWVEFLLKTQGDVPAKAGKQRKGKRKSAKKAPPPSPLEMPGEVKQCLRWIAPGRFMMGSPESEPERHTPEGPRHEVTLTEGFWLFDTAVTQALWEAVTGENPGRFKGPDRPVENVSWNDAQKFIAALNGILPGLDLRLPTEAQWEYACRASTQTPFYFGDNITPEQVNYDGNRPYADGAKGIYRQETVAVKSLPPNAWGLYEMHGNVWEWCEGYWSNNYPAKAQTDPAEPARDGLRVIRGGSWGINARSVRAAYRYYGEPDYRSDNRGLRCARVQSGARLAEAEPVPGAETSPKESRSQHPEQGGAGGLIQIADNAVKSIPWPRANNFILRADAGVLHVASLTKPAWAKEIGRDRYGLWAEFKLENVSQRLRWIPPGRFLMGSPKSEPERSYWEGPRHEVTLTEGFWLFDTTVTQALWKAVTGKNPSRFKGPDRPVENVSWNDAQEFIATVNGILPGSKFRLPTEAQWEYACRAGTQTPFYFGDNIMPEQVNYNGYFSYAGGAKGVRRGETVAVKSLPPNAWGLYEMHGNVWEWCEDYWSDNYPAEAQTDSAGPTVDGSRVFRGGSWDNYARDVRSAYRDRLGPDSRFGYRGFRCARVQA